MKINCTVFQDGADFYITEETDEGGGAYSVTSPFPVKDWDMEAAERARTLFIAAYERTHNITWEA